MNARDSETKGYRLHPDAYGDIDEIAAFVGEETSIDAADRVIDEIFERIVNLVPSEFRRQGHPRPDLTDRPLLSSRYFNISSPTHQTTNH